MNKYLEIAYREKVIIIYAALLGIFTATIMVLNFFRIFKGYGYLEFVTDWATIVFSFLAIVFVAYSMLGSNYTYKKREEERNKQVAEVREGVIEENLLVKDLQPFNYKKQRRIINQVHVAIIIAILLSAVAQLFY